MFQHPAARRRLHDSRVGTGFLGGVSTHSRPKAAAYLARCDAKGGLVSTHSRPKAAARLRSLLSYSTLFQHTAARRRLRRRRPHAQLHRVVSTHSRPKAAAIARAVRLNPKYVSTHSRPKAAACMAGSVSGRWRSFNTQPPEGGCLPPPPAARHVGRFNTQPPEGGCRSRFLVYRMHDGFNTQPPEGGCPTTPPGRCRTSCFNTQPPEGGCARAKKLMQE